MKNSIFKALPHRDNFLTDESLLTFVSEVSRVINARPLQYVSADEDSSVLTPAHMIIGSEITSEIICPFHISQDMKLRYKHLVSYLSKMWKRLINEYQPDLNTMSKWLDPKEPLKIGDVVLIKDLATPRGEWPLGIVEKCRPSHDPLQRVLEVRCRGKTLVRPFNKLAPLVRVNLSKSHSGDHIDRAE